MGKIIPIVLVAIGIFAGAGAGYVLRPAQKEQTNMSTHGADTPQEGHATQDPPAAEDATGHEYVKLNNQFVVPVLGANHVEALIVVALSVEVPNGRKDEVYAREPKLRDAFLQVLFDHSNTGGFRGTFTNSNNMGVLRRALLETAHDVTESLVTDVLIMDIARQDI